MEINGITGSPFTLLPSDPFSMLDKLSEILFSINEEANYKIWGYRPPNASSIVTGSMEAVVNSSIFQDDIPILRNRKINDIDLMIPMGTDKFLMDALTKLGIPNKKYGPQVFAMIDIDGVTRQVDFAMKPFFDSRPTDFACMSSSWYEDDARSGIRAVYHKLLLMSLTAAYDDADAFSMAYGIRERDKKEYVCEMEQIVLRLFDRDNQMEGLARSSLVGEAIHEEKLHHFRGVVDLMSFYMMEVERRKVREKFTRKMVDYDKSAKASPEEFDRVWALFEAGIEI